jgi:hypothetical protein
MCLLHTLISNKDNIIAICLTVTLNEQYFSCLIAISLSSTSGGSTGREILVSLEKTIKSYQLKSSFDIVNLILRGYTEYNLYII